MKSCPRLPPPPANAMGPASHRDPTGVSEIFVNCATAPFPPLLIPASVLPRFCYESIPAQPPDVSLCLIPPSVGVCLPLPHPYLPRLDLPELCPFYCLFSKSWDKV